MCIIIIININMVTCMTVQLFVIVNFYYNMFIQFFVSIS